MKKLIKIIAPLILLEIALFAPIKKEIVYTNHIKNVSSVSHSEKSVEFDVQEGYRYVEVYFGAHHEGSLKFPKIHHYSLEKKGLENLANGDSINLKTTCYKNFVGIIGESFTDKRIPVLEDFYNVEYEIIKQ